MDKPNVGYSFLKKEENSNIWYNMMNLEVVMLSEIVTKIQKVYKSIQIQKVSQILCDPTYMGHTEQSNS